NNFSLKFMSCKTRRALPRNLGLERKIESLTDCQSRMVDVVLSIVNSLASISFGKHLVVERPIQDFAIDFGIAISLVADHLEKRRTARARFAEYKNHLTRLRDTSKVLQNLAFFSFLSSPKNTLRGLIHVEKAHKGHGKSLDIILRSPNSLDGQIFPHNPYPLTFYPRFFIFVLIAS